MTTPEALEAALAIEFAGDVLFMSAPPSAYSPPQIVVLPDDPYLAPATHGTVEERWRVVVVASFKEPRAGFADLRDLSLRLARACQSAGAVWEQTRGPVTTGANTQTVLAEGAVRFKYLPPST
jgi:hypothetical protein